MGYFNIVSPRGLVLRLAYTCYHNRCVGEVLCPSSEEVTFVLHVGTAPTVARVYIHNPNP